MTPSPAWGFAITFGAIALLAFAICAVAFSLGVRDRRRIRKNPKEPFVIVHHRGRTFPVEFDGRKWHCHTLDPFERGSPFFDEAVAEGRRRLDRQIDDEERNAEIARLKAAHRELQDGEGEPSAAAANMELPPVREPGPGPGGGRRDSTERGGLGRCRTCGAADRIRCHHPPVDDTIRGEP